MRTRSHLPMVFICLVLVAAAVPTPAQLDREGSQVFAGRYEWSGGESGPLTTTFRPDGDDAWSVTFRFVFNGRTETWSGTANGSLADGSALQGLVTAGSRSWRFSATVEDGVLRAEHAEVKRGRAVPSGTFVVRR